MKSEKASVHPFAPKTEQLDKAAILEQWEAADRALAAAKERELELRLKVVGAWLPTHKDEGTENVELANGYKLKMVFKVNRTLGDAEAVEKALQRIEKVDAEGKFIADRIIKFKPSLDKKEYDNCPTKYRKYIDEVLTTKPGTPSVELVPPKVKK